MGRPFHTARAPLTGLTPRILGITSANSYLTDGHCTRAPLPLAVVVCHAFLWNGRYIGVLPSSFQGSKETPRGNLTCQNSGFVQDPVTFCEYGYESPPGLSLRSPGK
jgi:hypothetical protein